MPVSLPAVGDTTVGDVAVGDTTVLYDPSVLHDRELAMTVVSPTAGIPTAASRTVASPNAVPR
jgi:hypothetical protein